MAPPPPPLLPKLARQPASSPAEASPPSLCSVLTGLSDAQAPAHVLGRAAAPDCSVLLSAAPVSPCALAHLAPLDKGLVTKLDAFEEAAATISVQPSQPFAVRSVAAPL
eukprot:6182102-Pleurochrysis_carterae.AAC.1